MFLMPITRHSSRHSAHLARSFDRLFDEGLFDRHAAASRSEAPATRSPAVDVAETDTAYTLKLDMPGVAKQDVKIAIEGRRVRVEASTHASNTNSADKADSERLLYSERSVAGYARSFTLPAEVDQASSKATMDQGVLTLQLAKRTATQPTQLTVN